MRYCMYCGNEVNENAIVCVKCGARLPEQKQQPVQPAYTPPAQNYTVPQGTASVPEQTIPQAESSVQNYNFPQGTAADVTQSSTSSLSDAAGKIKLALIIMLAGTVAISLLYYAILFIGHNSIYRVYSFILFALSAAVSVICLLLILKLQKNSATDIHNAANDPLGNQNGPSM